jgi:transposase
MQLIGEMRRLSGEHMVHDTQVKRFRHLNFFQRECDLEVRVPRVKLADGKVKRASLPTQSGSTRGSRTQSFNPAGYRPQP